MPPTQVSISALLQVLLQLPGLLFQPARQGHGPGTWHCQLALVPCLPFYVREAQLCALECPPGLFPLTEARGHAPKGYELTIVTAMSWGRLFGRWQMELLPTPGVATGAPTNGQADKPCGSETWQKALAIVRSQPLPLGCDTHCCSFPYSRSKSLSTCNERESSIIREMTTLEKICQPPDTPSTPSPLWRNNTVPFAQALAGH